MYDSYVLFNYKHFIGRESAYRATKSSHCHKTIRSQVESVWTQILFYQHDHLFDFSCFLDCICLGDSHT